MLEKSWKKTKGKDIQCTLCSQFCELSAVGNSLGKCGVRKNEDGFLVSLIENKIVSYNVDPIEKKPLYHFLPNTPIFSVGSMGCNFDCAWCQNSSIAHPQNQEEAKQGSVVDANTIINTSIQNHCKSIAFTYNEPTMFFDLMLECAVEAKEKDIKSVIVSNGYQSPQTLKTLLPFIDAANIDLKSFDNKMYQKYCGANLKPVLQNIKEIAKSNTWLEITTLLIPSINDNKNELKHLAHFIANEVGTHVPWHVSAFYPSRNMMHLPPTSKESLQEAYEIGKTAGLEYVYVGNIQNKNETQCPHCRHILVTRNGYHTKIQDGFEGTCPNCETKIPGVWV